MFKTVLIIVLTFLAGTSAFSSISFDKHKEIKIKLAKLEKEFDGKIGIYAIDTNNNKTFGYRENERFSFQSTLKLIGASALLSSKAKHVDSISEIVHYKNDDLMFWSPITKKNLANGMSLEELAAATMAYSDNTAINLIMKKLGGPSAVTEYARSIGNKTFNLIHYEGDLDSNPKTIQDTSTPKDMAISVEKITLGDELPQPLQIKLIEWMKNNTTGYKRIRAGVPLGWSVADKTGSGDYGIANDIGIAWSPACKPIVLSIYTARNSKAAQSRDDIIASTTTLVLDEFSKINSCFEATKI